MRGSPPEAVVGVGLPPPCAPLRPRPAKVTVVMPVLNALDTIVDQLDALSRQEYDGDWELIIADNGSSDGSIELAAHWASSLPALRVVDASGRRGCTHARNVGIEAATGDFVAICDADDIASRQWLASMADAARYGDIVGGRLDHVTLNEPTKSEWRGRGGDEALPAPMNFLRHALGANTGAWKSVFAALGGYTEDFPYGADDVEFSWRAQLEGFTLVFAKDAVIAYRHRPTLSGHARQTFTYARAEVQLYRRYRGSGLERKRLGALLAEVSWLASRLPFLIVSVGRRGLWLGRAAQLAGRLRGSLEHQVFFA